MKKYIFAIVGLFVIALAGCSNTSSGGSGSSSGGGSGVVFTGTEYQNGLDENYKTVKFPLTDTLTFYEDGTWILNSKGEMPFVNKKIKADLDDFAGTYSGNPAVDGSVTLITKKKSKKWMYIPDPITNEQLPLEDIEESKWKTDTITISGGKFSDFATINLDAGQVVEFTRK